MPKPVWSVEQIAAYLVRNRIAWPVGETVAYSFYTIPAAHLGSVPNFSTFSPAQRQALAGIFDLIADIVPLNFHEVPDNGQDPGWANKRIGFYNLNSQTVPFWGAATNFDVAASGNPSPIYGADVIVNLWRANAQGNWGPGDSNTRKLMHEAMHTLGVSHPGDYNGDSALNYENEAEYMQDSTQYTVMSYWTAANTGAVHSIGGILYHAATPLIHDIAALQHLYGANMSTRTGDTVYGFNSTAGRPAYDIAVNKVPVFAIWDAGGRDTLDLSGFATPSRIDLNEGAFTDAAGLTSNISIAYGAVIENAKGGSGDDSIAGNAAANRLEGGGGADRIGGGRGVDSLVGGSGGDVFVFDSLGDSHSYQARSDGKKYVPDALTDFRSGEDRIDLSGIDAVWGTEANEAFTLVGAAAFTNRPGELRWEQAVDRIHVFADVDGNGTADFHIIVMADSIAASDFIL